MPISPDRIRELAARRESALLDFKEFDYDWEGKSKNPKASPANTELAKDLMAMANVMRRNSEPAYILIGVKDGGEICGIPEGEHLDDADLHQKVKYLLTPTPTFAYAPVDVDGMSVGVYEIRGGHRPYFPLKDVGAIQRHVARYREGSSTDVASPTMILEWSREDDPDAYRLRTLELRKAEAEALIRGKIYAAGSDISNDVAVDLHFQNTGRSGFEIERVEWRVEWNQRFFDHLGKSNAKLPDGYLPPRGSFTVKPSRFYLPPGQFAEHKFRWTRIDACTHLATVQVPGFSGAWVTLHFEAICHGELGADGSVVGVVNL